MMDKKTAIIICSYNMWEWADALVEHIYKTVKVPYELIFVDNGSDIVEPSKYTNYWIPENVQMIPGFMAGFRFADSLYQDFYAYWMLTTSCKFNEDDKRDPLAKLLKVLEDDDKAYAVQPSLTFNYGAWEKWLIPRQPPVSRRMFALENVCPLFRAKYFDELGRFREELTLGWGISAEMYWKARKAGYHIYTHDGYVMHKETEIGYTMDRMGMDAKTRRKKADQQSKDVLVPIYGVDYLNKLNSEYKVHGAGGEY